MNELNTKKTIKKIGVPKHPKINLYKVAFYTLLIVNIIITSKNYIVNQNEKKEILKAKYEIFLYENHYIKSAYTFLLYTKTTNEKIEFKFNELY